MSRAARAYRDQLRDVRERLVRSNLADPALVACTTGLERVEDVLRKPLRIVILGEYNSGKTSVVDLLIGDRLLPTSVVSNTRMPVLVSYAPSAALYGIDRSGTRIRIDGDDALTDLAYRALHVTLPLERLEDYELLDTPSSVDPGAFVADADIVIWCTVATRAWTESERLAWSGLPRRCRRNGVLVATHRDDLRTAEDCEHVAARLRQLTSGLFRSVVLVGAGGLEEGGRDGAGAGEATSSAALLQAAVAVVADSILERKRRKAEILVRRLSRLTLHEFAKREVRADAVTLLATWDTHARSLADDLAAGRRGQADTIESLLTSYALFAERLRPGVVTGDHSPSVGRAVTAPPRAPAQGVAATRLVDTLVSDLTALLRLLAGTSTYMDPAVRLEIETVRSLLLALADLDGAFAALAKVVGRG